MSQITVRRIKSCWNDRLRDYKVIVDGREAVRVSNGGVATVAVEPGKHTVYVAIDWCRSRPVEVSVAFGQTVQLDCGPNVKPFLELVYALVLFRRWIWLSPATNVAL